MHPVHSSSGKTSVAEEKYANYELEVLVKALRKFRVYLIGISFKVVTDCKAVMLIMSKKDLCVRVARWALLLEEINYTPYIVEHCQVKSGSHVDELSRNPLPMLLNDFK